MNLKNTLISVAMVLSLAPAAAFADHVHSENCRHDADYRPMPQTYENQGRYELRTVKKWVEGYWDQQWVPQQCVTRGRWHQVTKCRGGGSERRWIPGHYEATQEWVWVPNVNPGPIPPPYNRPPLPPSPSRQPANYPYHPASPSQGLSL
jgi:hypothetical protein